MVEMVRSLRLRASKYEEKEIQTLDIDLSLCIQADYRKSKKTND